MCIQESLLWSHNYFRINGFKVIRNDIVAFNKRGTCILIRENLTFNIFDLSSYYHPSWEIQGIILPLDDDNDSLVIINVYRHPNQITPFNIFNLLFTALTNNFCKVVFVGDFNAHHLDWEDFLTDFQGERISQESEAYHLVIMNDGCPTFQSSPNFSTSIIDLAFASRPLAPLINFKTSPDLHDSDRYPIRISIRDTHPSVYRFRINITYPLLNFLSSRITSHLEHPVLRKNYPHPHFQTQFKNTSTSVKFSMRLFSLFPILKNPSPTKKES